MSRRAHNDPEYRAYRRWLTAHPDTPCAFCGDPVGTDSDVDHHPPLADHHHTRGTHCCRLRPACATCNRSSGAAAGNRKREPHSELW